MAHGPEHGPAKKHAGGHGHEGGHKNEAHKAHTEHKAHAEHKPHAEHKHESAGHGDAHNEWIGRKTKEALQAGGLTAYLSTALTMAAGIAMPAYLIGLLGVMGMGIYAFGARSKSGGH